MLRLVEAVAGHEHLQQGLFQAAAPAARRPHFVGQELGVRGHDLAEQLGLVGEVGEDRPRGHAGRRGDIADGGAFVALLAEQVAGRGQHFQAGLLLGQRSSGRALHLGFGDGLGRRDVLHGETSGAGAITAD
jgi:hypothetical protein